MQCAIAITAYLVFIMNHTSVATGNTTSMSFSRQKGPVSTSEELTTVNGRSVLDCAVSCSMTEGCETFNICRKNSSATVTCRLLGRPSSNGSEGLTTDTSSGCRYFEKQPATHFEVETSTPQSETTPTFCKNNGAWNGTHCQCVPGYGGHACEQIYRDCRYLYEDVYNGQTFEGWFWIHPTGAPSPIKVYCLYKNKPYTIVYIRNNNMNWSLVSQWTRVKDGFRQPLNASFQLYGPGDYFIGMDNFHLITSQGLYWLQVDMLHGNAQKGRVVYKPFSIDAASTEYTMRIGSTLYDDNKPARTGFARLKTSQFSTLDDDCAASKGGMGWYGPWPECSGYSPFREQYIWPLDYDYNEALMYHVRWQLINKDA